MNPVLAQIYGTGFSKTASDDNDELDLNSISAAQLLEMLEQTEEPEKVANDEVDLSKMSARELVELMEAAEGLEGEEAEKVAYAQMVEDGSFDYFDRAGRILAHAYADEMGKVASAPEESPDEIEVDLDNMTGAELAGLLEQGYEFSSEEVPETDDAEKVAGRASELLSRLGEEFTKRTGRTASGLKMEAGMKGRHYAGMALEGAKEHKGKLLAAGAGATGVAAYKMKKKK